MAEHAFDQSCDPRGLIAEAYNIPGLTAIECRSIFFDWAIGRSAAEGDPDAVAALLALYEPVHPDHPMTQVLREGGRTLGAPARRRGGRRTGGPDDPPR
ncbi:MAG: hypothetical protein ACJA1L_000691 [Paracoccaceae bacterium]|jgi:hypothetical protein